MKSSVTDPFDNTIDDPTTPVELVIGTHDLTTVTKVVSDIALERKTPLAWYAAFACTTWSMKRASRLRWIECSTSATP